MKNLLPAQKLPALTHKIKKEILVCSECEFMTTDEKALDQHSLQHPVSTKSTMKTEIFDSDDEQSQNGRGYDADNLSDLTVYPQAKEEAEPTPSTSRHPNRIPPTLHTEQPTIR